MNARLLATILAALLSGLMLSQPAHATSPVEGVWRASDGSGAARIAACSDDDDTLCATEITLGSGTPVAGRVVLRDLRQTSENRWRGRYLLGRDTLPATIELRSADLAAMTACRWLICQTVTYERVSS